MSADPETAVIVGIDPGLTGAIAAIWPHSGALETWDMPLVSTAHLKNGKRGERHEIDMRALADLLQENVPCGHVFIEQVHGGSFGPARIGAVSMFRFGYLYGAILATVTSFGLAHTLVSPQRWKRAVGLVSGATKDDSRLRAQALYPGMATRFARKRDDGRADAALIAHYGYMEYASGRVVLS